jgi:hypothetical protein
MVDYCANPNCMKPLHYLREGTIYIFEVKSGAPGSHRLEHYWLCGDCSVAHLLERTPSKELRLVPKESLRFVRQPAVISEPAVVSEADLGAIRPSRAAVVPSRKVRIAS